MASLADDAWYWGPERLKKRPNLATNPLVYKKDKDLENQATIRSRSEINTNVLSLLVMKTSFLSSPCLAMSLPRQAPMSASLR